MITVIFTITLLQRSKTLVEKIKPDKLQRSDTSSAKCIGLFVIIKQCAAPPELPVLLHSCSTKRSFLWNSNGWFQPNGDYNLNCIY